MIRRRPKTVRDLYTDAVLEGREAAADLMRDALMADPSTSSTFPVAPPRDCRCCFAVSGAFEVHESYLVEARLIGDDA